MHGKIIKIVNLNILEQMHFFFPRNLGNKKRKKNLQELNMCHRFEILKAQNQNSAPLLTVNLKTFLIEPDFPQ